MVSRLRQNMPDSGDLAPVFRTDIRAIRRARGLRLADVARAAGRSVGWLSEVERDLTTPTGEDLELLARLLDVPLTALICGDVPGCEAGRIVRTSSRRPVPTTIRGLDQHWLSPDPADPVQMVHSVIAPGARHTDRSRRDRHELGYVQSGRLMLWIGAGRHDLSAGDSFRTGGDPVAWVNPHRAPCTVIWVYAAQG
jgi:transcriptional regulator with XRE-family HTH domain